MNQKPKNLNQLVERLVSLENENKLLNKKLKAYENANSQARVIATSLLSMTRRKSSFTNYEVKRYANEIIEAASRLPLYRKK